MDLISQAGLNMNNPSIKRQASSHGFSESFSWKPCYLLLCTIKRPYEELEFVIIRRKSQPHNLIKPSENQHLPLIHNLFLCIRNTET